MTPKFKVTIKDVAKGIKDVMRESDRMLRRNNQHLAGQIRLAASRSMKNAPRTLPGRPRAHARPGQPPLAHRKAIKNFLRYAYESQTRSFVVGPEKLNYTGLTQRSLEMGEPTMVMTTRRGMQVWIEVPMQARPYMGPAKDRVMTPANIRRVYENSLKQRKF